MNEGANPAQPVAPVGAKDTVALPAPSDPGFSRYLLDEAPAAVVATDTSGTIIYYNRAAAGLHGWHDIDATGRNLRELLWPPMPDMRVERAAESAVNTGYWSGELALLGASGELFPAYVTLKLLGGPETGILLGTVHDVSAQKTLEGQLVQAQKMEALGTLAGGMAHEFNNLLVGILGASRLAMDQTEEASELRELIEMVEDAGLRGKDLVSQVLSFSRRETPSLDPIDAADVIDDLMKMIHPTLPKGIAIEKEVAAELPQIMADRSRLMHALLNLCVNSADAMGEQGTLMVRARVARGLPADHLDAPEESDGEYVCFEVKDSGPGMTPKLLRRVLDPFFTTKGKGRGTGLGLPLVKSTTEAQGGKLRIWSTLQEGTRIAVYFPMLEARIQSVPAASHALTADYCGTETVLVVDDEDLVRRVTRRALQRCGYQVLEAGDGRAGFEAIASHPGEVALVVLDMVMPGMDGREFFWELQKTNPEIPVLLNSGFSVEGRVGQLLEGGAAGFLSKPYELVDLLRAVRSAIDGVPGQPAV